MSRVNGEGGLVLTWKPIDSPARTLVLEQYPSTHGQRYFVFGSTRVLVSSQSRVPGLSFSRRINSRRAGTALRAERTDSMCAQPPMAVTAPRPTTPFSNSRRLIRPVFSVRLFRPERRLFCFIAV